MKKQVTLGKFEPFSELIYAQDGKCRVQPGQSLTPDEIIEADWLPDNVIGRLPEVSELAPQFREFAKWHSIHKLHP